MSAARPEGRPLGEVLRIAGSVTLYCALGGAILGLTYAATARYQEASRAAGERSAVAELLGTRAGDRVLELRQYLDEAREQVIYRAGPMGEPPATEAAFTLEGALVRRGAPAPRPQDDDALRPIGRTFVVVRADSAAGFVVEGEARGYKNVIRFFVGLDGAFEILGVRVLEHEEDPGLGAEVATPWFRGQFVGRSGAAVSGLGVTRDPMPEDWRSALLELRRTPAARWRERHADLLRRESGKPIYAVSGATISSRALTEGVKTTVDHFRRRWALVAPHVRGAS